MTSEFAMVPMSARRTKFDKSTQENTEAPRDDAIDIVGHYPAREQLEPVRRIQIIKNTSRQPQISVSAVGNGGSLSGIGTTEQGTFEDVQIISLTPNLQTWEDWPTKVEW
jgi:hypothetical protein